MSGSLGDFDTSAVIYGKFTTYRPSTGAPYTLAGTPALSVYKDNSTTQSTTGVTLTADFDSVTGLNHFAVDTSADGTFYSAGSFFDVVITTGTVDSVSAVGTVVGRFTLRKTSPLRPTTAGRTLDVSAGGESGIDWANVGSPTTSLALTGTTIATTQQVDVNTIKTQTVTAAAGVTFPAEIASPTNITAGTITTVTNLTNLPSIPTNWLTAAGIAADAVTEIQSGLATAADLATVAGYLDTEVAAILEDTGTTLPAQIAALNNISAADVWASGTRTLTANPGLDAAGVRTAVGLATANLDTQLADIPTVAEFEARTIAAANYATASTSFTAAPGATFVSAVQAGLVKKSVSLRYTNSDGQLKDVTITDTP